MNRFDDKSTGIKEYPNKYEEALINVDNCLDYHMDENVQDDIKLLGELVERATPKKVLYKIEEVYIGVFDEYNYCPKCNQDIVKTNYCEHCGQALDWDNDNN